MVAGLNLTAKIWRYIYTYGDDDIGGAVPSGTVLYQDVQARIAARKPTMALIEQGLETIKIFTAVLSPGTLAVKENDEIEVTRPTNHPDYGNKFRIIGVQPTSTHPDDARGFLMVTLQRSEEAHATQ
jgi:hypothetical protein